MKPLSARLREKIEHEPIVRGWDNVALVECDEYRKLQKLALLLPECVESLRAMKTAMWSENVDTQNAAYEQADETLKCIERGLEEMG